MGMVTGLKNALTSSERKPHRILTGSFSGIVMRLSLRSQAQVYLGLYERETYKWIKRLSKGISTAVDIGVSQGEYTIYFLTKTKATRIFAFEPDTRCLPLIDKNLELNGVDRQSGRLELSTKSVGISDTEEEIRLDTLAGSVHAPCFVKMDVDGFEEHILRGATVFNGLPDVRWLIETHSRELEIACMGILTAAGFETRIVPYAWWRVFVPELRPSGSRWLAAWKK
jgi:hypothetical protein